MVQVSLGNSRMSMSNSKVEFRYSQGIVSRTDSDDAVIVNGALQYGACGLSEGQVTEAFALWNDSRPNLPEGWTLVGLDGKTHVRSPDWVSYFEIEGKTANDFEQVAKWIRSQLEADGSVE